MGKQQYRHLHAFIITFLVTPFVSYTYALENPSSTTACGFSPVVYAKTCSGTLIHPRVISTAAHCNLSTGDKVFFGQGESPSKDLGYTVPPSPDSFGLSVAIEKCWRPAQAPTDGTIPPGKYDVSFCILEYSVPNIPIIPIIQGCEIDQYLFEDQKLTLVGFGAQGDGVSLSGERKWGVSTITDIDDGPESEGTIIVRAKELGESAARSGDSGGPALVRIDDGSWRIAGSTHGGNAKCGRVEGTNRYECTDTWSVYAPLYKHIAEFETDEGIDISPCFDATTGNWDAADENCGNFYAGDSNDAGDWLDTCGTVPTVAQSFTCGMPLTKEIKEVKAEQLPVSNDIATRGKKEHIVLRFKLNNNITGAKIKSVALTAEGNIDDSSDIKKVSLFHQKSQSTGASIEIGSGLYTQDNGDLHVELTQPLALELGDNYFFLTYDF